MPNTRPKLWTRNFILATAGMVISALGGVGLNLALGVVVFQETQSTLLTGIFTALSFIPEFLLPLVVGPYIDRRDPLKVLVRNEVMLGFIFLAIAAATWAVGFNYLLYLGFTLVFSSFGVVSELAASSIIPQIMDKANYSRGNAIISTIYPLCQVLVVPAAMVLFERFGMPLILLFYGVCCLLDAFLESHIKVEFEYIREKAAGLRAYFGDLAEGFTYFKNDPAIRSVFIYFAFVMFANETTILIYPFFNQTPGLSNASYAMLESIRSAGYMLGGFFHYFVHIPDKKRYGIAIGVYVLFLALDSTFFFMSLWMMCTSVFILGVGGMNSANIRVSAVQSRVPAVYRAKVNAFYTVLIYGAMTLGRFTAGALGEVLDYWMVQVLFSAISGVALVSLMLPRKNKVRALYNFDSTHRAAETTAG